VINEKINILQIKISVITCVRSLTEDGTRISVGFLAVKGKQEEVLGRRNSVLSFDMTRTA
jgi:hypothetical protein